VGQPIDIIQRSLPEPELLALEGVEQIERRIVLWVRSKGAPPGLACNGIEVRYHSTYFRHLRDLPWQRQQVHIQWKTRRFRCRNRRCQRDVFMDRQPGVAARGYAKRIDSHRPSDCSFTFWVNCRDRFCRSVQQQRVVRLFPVPSGFACILEWK